ncbi:carbonic anhydrase family protein [Longispora sp. NPDC051575]|uniref:carbonic anhydrase family protein n=1 Tax=Longispora sp. NPDC051575 TaxID=3154943 RepID=UPI00341B8DBB
MPGQQQSPVDLVSADAIGVSPAGGRVTVDWRSGDQEFTVRRKSSGYRFKPHEGGQTVLLESREYGLAEVHFHLPSEHWIDGASFDAELHAVHVRAEDGVRRCAVSVLLNLAGGAHEHAEPTPPTSFDLGALLPPDRAFYRYEGSLTTPDYGERVSWIVMRDPVAVTDPQLRRFILDGADEARDPYPLDRRFVLADHCAPRPV